MKDLKIIMEDNAIIAVHKPAGLAVQTARLGQMDLYHMLMNHLAEEQTGDAAPYLAVINRLDQPVEGIVLFAKTQEAAALLSDQIQIRSMKKGYLAVVQGEPMSQETLVDFLKKDAKTNVSKIVPAKMSGAKKAMLTYRCLKKDGDRALLAIELMTGRHHQIRLQLANAELPIVGDRKYGIDCKGGLALCSTELSFRHPVTEETVELKVTPMGENFASIL